MSEEKKKQKEKKRSFAMEMKTFIPLEPVGTPPFQKKTKIKRKEKTK